MKLLGSPRRMPSMTGYGLEVTGFVAGTVLKRGPQTMKDADKGQSAALDGEGLRIGIVRARFNDALTGALAAGLPRRAGRARRGRRATSARCRCPARWRFRWR